MSIRIMGLAAALVGAVLADGVARAGADKKELPAKVRKAQQTLADALTRLKAQGGQVAWIHSRELAAAFPRDTFFAVRFRQFPVARILPEGFRASNVFVVAEAGKAKKLADVPALLKFFSANLPPQRTTLGAKDAVAAWLTLSQEFVQDGFYLFEILTKEIEVAQGDQGTMKATGRAMVTRGGNGALRVTLVFDEKGRLKDAVEESKIRPGPRPICQATKLLDADPIVRRMAEEDLVIMGRAARDYLQEQRARANPELQKAIDRLWRRIQDEE
jgi:hypothetical protein